MSVRHYTLNETLAEIEGLTPDQVQGYIAAGVLQPVHSERGPLFRDVDLARLGLLVDLSEGYHMDEEALRLVMSLLDQLHGLRGDMRAMLDALSREPAETRDRIRSTIREVRVVIRN